MSLPLEKIVKIENVGRFVSLAAKGDVRFKRLTLIYGSNGHGKTTLSSILRSLQTRDPAHVRERATLGAGSAPHAEILLTSGYAIFKDGKWSATLVSLNDASSGTVDLKTARHSIGIFADSQPCATLIRWGVREIYT